MIFLGQLVPGQRWEEVRFLRRYKRFLVDVERSDGSVLTVHNPNTGSMKSCLREGRRAAISWKSPEQIKRTGARLPATLELLHSGRGWIGVNTMRTNSLVLRALLAGALDPGWKTSGRDARELLSPSAVQRLEQQGSRANQYLMEPTLQNLDFRPDLYWKGGLLEVKNVTQLEGDYIQFPDAVSQRGTKHLQELGALSHRGYNCGVIFVLSRPEGEAFRPAVDIDPEFARALVASRNKGLLVLAQRFRYTLRGVYCMDKLPVHAGPHFPA